MANKKHKDGFRTTVYMSKDLFETMQAYTEETGVPQTWIIEKAVDIYLKDKGYDKDKRNVANI